MLRQAAARFIGQSGSLPGVPHTPYIAPWGQGAKSIPCVKKKKKKVPIYSFFHLISITRGLNSPIIYLPMKNKLTNEKIYVQNYRFLQAVVGVRHQVNHLLICPYTIIKGRIKRSSNHLQIGFVWVMAVGSIISLLWRQMQPWEKSGQSHPDPALFTPPLARRLRAKFEEKSDIQVTDKQRGFA